MFVRQVNNGGRDVSSANPSVPTTTRGRLTVVLATVVINVVAVSLLVLVPWSDWRTGAALNLVDNALLIGFVLARRDRLLGRFLLFGLVVGLTELAADAWLVDSTRTLDYSVGGGPMIWRSPLWMPLAWEVVAVQFGRPAGLMVLAFIALFVALTPAHVRTSESQTA